MLKLVLIGGAVLAVPVAFLIGCIIIGICDEDDG
jgi:hypothetical protein